VFHLGTNGDSYFYAMEFVDGESLDKVIRQSGRLDPSTALNVTALVAAGLEAIDKEDLVHRDIKPSNIMVSMHGDANAKLSIWAWPKVRLLTTVRFPRFRFREVLPGHLSMRAPNSSPGSERTYVPTFIRLESRSGRCWLARSLSRAPLRG